MRAKPRNDITPDETAESDYQTNAIAMDNNNNNNDDEADDCGNTSNADSEMKLGNNNNNDDEAYDCGNTTSKVDSEMKLGNNNNNNDDEADDCGNTSKVDSEMKLGNNNNNNDDEADDALLALKADSDNSNAKIVTQNDDYHYNYSLLYNFKRLEKNEIASSSEYAINYVGPILSEDVANEKLFFSECVDDTCAYIVNMYNVDILQETEANPFDCSSYQFINHDYVKEYLTMLRSNYLFDMGFKVRNEHQLIDVGTSTLRLCRCPCNMDIWMNKTIQKSLIVNKSDECDCDINWFTPVELMEHLESTFLNDTSKTNDQPWLHYITWYFLDIYYKRFFPNPWTDSRPLGTHYIHVYKNQECNIKGDLSLR